MSLCFETIQTAGLAQFSYLLGDSADGRAAVIDPRPDVDVYLDLAAGYDLVITDIFETHIHADFLSGARELAQRCAGAAIHCSATESAGYGFEYQPLADGDVFAFGSLRLTVRHTPGHTPEHVAVAIADDDQPERPWGVFSGDALFNGSAGRPDLLGQGERELATALHRTIHDYFLALPDHVLVYPGHGAGSGCGASIGERPVTTIGWERRNNPFCRDLDRDAFIEFVLGDTPDEPTHYSRLKQVNAAGPPVIGHSPQVRALRPRDFERAAGQPDSQVLDTRDMLAFAAGHIHGAINIGLRAELSIWAGWALDPELPIHLVVSDPADLDEVVALLWRVGLTEFGGYLAGGMTAWAEAGLHLNRMPALTIHELQRDPEDYAVLDVRSDSEWGDGHIPGATHRFVGDLIHNGHDLPEGRPLVTYCGSGYRASLAASLLERRGDGPVRNLPGSWLAWKSAGYPVAQD